MTMLHLKPTMRKGECQPSSIHRVLKACLEMVAPWRVASALLDFLFQREHALRTASRCSHLWDLPYLWSTVHALPGQPQPVTEHGQGTRGQSFLPNAGQLDRRLKQPRVWLCQVRITFWGSPCPPRQLSSTLPLSVCLSLPFEMEFS